MTPLWALTIAFPGSTSPLTVAIAVDIQRPVLHVQQEFARIKFIGIRPNDILAHRPSHRFPDIPADTSIRIDHIMIDKEAEKRPLKRSIPRRNRERDDRTILYLIVNLWSDPFGLEPLDENRHVALHGGEHPLGYGHFLCLVRLHVLPFILHHFQRAIVSTGSMPCLSNSSSIDTSCSRVPLLM